MARQEIWGERSLSSEGKEAWQFPLGELGSLKIEKGKNKWTGTIFLNEENGKPLTNFTYYADDASKTRESFDQALIKKLGKESPTLYQDLVKLGATVLAEHFTELIKEVKEPNTAASQASEDWEGNATKYKDRQAALSAIANILSIEDKELSSRDKYLEATRIAYKHFFSNGNFYYHDLAQEGYWFDGNTKRLLKLESERFKAFVADSLGFNREETAFKWTFSGIRDRVAEHALKIEPHRLSFYDEKNHTLYFNNKPGRMLKIDGTNVVEIDNGEGALFQWEEDWEEWEYIPSSSVKKEDSLWQRLIYNRLTLDERETQLTLEEASALLDCFVLVLPFRETVRHRPLLSVVGPWGSGKTLFLSLMGFAFFGSHFTVLGLEDQKQDGAIAYVTNSIFGVFDNADERIRWLPDLLARIATGAAIPRRKLYTTNELVKYPVDLLLGITARTTPWARPDVISRLLLLKVKQPDEFIDEKLLINSVLKNRPALLSQLIDRCNSAIRRLVSDAANADSPGSPSRLAGFYSFARTVSEDRETLDSAFDKMLTIQGIMAVEEVEDLLTLLLDWIHANTTQTTITSTKTDCTPERTTTQLYKELVELAGEEKIDLGIRNSTALGIQLKQNASAFKEAGIIVKWKHTSKGNTWIFCVDRKDNERSGSTSQNNPSDPSHPSGTIDLRSTSENGLVKGQPTPDGAFTKDYAQNEGMKGVNGPNDDSMRTKGPGDGDSTEDSRDCAVCRKPGADQSARPSNGSWVYLHHECQDNFLGNL